jgi:surface polysaccharide O-acyltransferase-like enzyme
MARAPVMSRSSLALDNLRAVVILIVLAFHSVLAYVSWIPARASGFGSPPYGWRAFPILDAHRWAGFDIFCAWQDVYLMSLMFLLSGLFVYPSLARKKNWGFVRDRLLRLGVPFLFGVIVLTPIAEYPAYAVTAPEPGIADYFRTYIALPFLPNGQLWFLWQLLALNFIVTALNFVAPSALRSLGRWSTQLGRRPLFYLGTLIAISAIAYVPLALAFTPWAWSDSGPLAIQFSRPLLYCVYFFAGVGIGAGGIDEGLVAAEGDLSKRWWLWLAAALAALFAWMGVTYLTLEGPAPILVQVASGSGFVVACASGCAFLIAASLRFGLTRSSPLASLSTNAYSLYLVHYVFVVWMQFALLALNVSAVLKAPMVFIVALVVSWIIILAVQRIPLGARLIGVRPTPVAA